MFLPYDALKISTQTYVVHTGLTIPPAPFFAAIECVPLAQRLRAAKRMDFSLESLTNGDIVYVHYENQSKGAVKELKPKTLKVVTIIMYHEQTFYNVKIGESGKLQITGCRCLETVLFIVHSLFQRMRRLEMLTPTYHIPCLIMCAMSNVNIEIPFHIHCDRLHDFVNNHTPHISILEKSVGYVAVNIKIHSDIESKEDTTIEQVTFSADGSRAHTPARFADYFAVCEKKKKYKKIMYNSFLVFASGKTIMSGCASYLNRKDAYDTFVRIVQEARSQIEL